MIMRCALFTESIAPFVDKQTKAQSARADIFYLIERFRTTFTANGRNDHVTIFILHLPLTVFSFSS